MTRRALLEGIVRETVRTPRCTAPWRIAERFNPRGFIFKPVWPETLVLGSIREVFSRTEKVSFWNCGLRTI